jgi:hypothetical protein
MGFRVLEQTAMNKFFITINDGNCLIAASFDQQGNIAGWHYDAFVHAAPLLKSCFLPVARP